MDQANRLRDIVQQRVQQIDEMKGKLNVRVITITSGKGGVGKSNVAVNLAIQLRKQQKRVVIIDADFGLANVEVLLGAHPVYNFKDVLSGIVTLDGALTQGPMGIQFLSGGSGLASISDISDPRAPTLIESFSYLEEKADIVLIDTGAGITKPIVSFIKASRETILVTTSEPTALMDAYALLKAAYESDGEMPQVKVIVNKIYNPLEGTEAFEKLQRVSNQFLGLRLFSLGNIPYDNHLVKAVKRQEPVLLAYPNADCSKCFDAIGAKITNAATSAANGGMRGFIGKLFLGNK